MRLEDLRNEYPETPQFIHDMINRQVERHLKKDSAPSKKLPKRSFGARTVLIAAACVIGISSAVYAGAVMAGIDTHKEGEYGAVTAITADDSTQAVALPEYISDVDFEIAEIPQGMQWMDEYHLQYPEANRTGGFSFAASLLSEADFDAAIADKDVVYSEKRTFGNYEGVYLEYQSLLGEGDFNKRIYLLCPDYNRVLTIYIGEDVPRETAFSAIDSLSLKENGTMIATADMHTWTNEADPDIEYVETASQTLPASELKIYNIGDSFDIEAYAQNSDGEYGLYPVTAKVDNFTVSDKIELLPGMTAPDEWSSAVNSDGTLKTNTLKYIKSGDGINTVDEIVKTEEVAQKFVRADITYTNNTDAELNSVLFYATLMLIKNDGSNYTLYTPDELAGEDYDRVIWDGAANTLFMECMSVSDEEGKNYISSIKPGESATVSVAWIVNENDLNDLYLNLDGSGSPYVFGETLIKNQFVDIRK